jgi:hypothetical protein
MSLDKYFKHKSLENEESFKASSYAIQLSSMKSHIKSYIIFVSNLPPHLKNSGSGIAHNSFNYHSTILTHNQYNSFIINITT